MKGNPFTTVFGQEPVKYVARPLEKAEILEKFQEELPLQPVYMITGVRGSGKTVFMTDIADELKKQKDWIVVQTGSDGNIFEKVASFLAAENQYAHLFKQAKINLSFFGFGLEVSGEPPITNLEVALTKMLESLARKNKRVLIAIDEVVNTPSIREFASAYQQFILKKLPVFLLMTGLYENIEEIQNEKNLTFLYRAPKIYMGPLNINAVKETYLETFQIDEPEAIRLARMTRGYSYGFQVLGYLLWENGGQYDSRIRTQYQTFLNEYVYTIIWRNMSEKDRLVAYGIAKSGSSKVADIRAFLQMETNQFTPYRSRLIKKGIISGDKWGKVRFLLPDFEPFVIQEQEIPDYE